MRILVFLVAIGVCAQVQAATLRRMTTMHGPDVFLRDLFDDAGPNAGRVLGTGPEPGGVMSLEASQLDAIARIYNVAWRSVSSADRARLEWPGRPMRKEEATEAVRIAITAVGATPDIDVDIAGFNPPIIPYEADAASTTAQVDYDSITGHFTALLSVTAEKMNPIHVRITGHADAMMEAPVAVTRLLPETILRQDDIRVSRVRSTLLQNEFARSIDEIVGMQLRRPVQAGQPLRLADLVRPTLVQRGAVVRVELSGNSFSLSEQATALDNGAEGDNIRLQNMNSKAFLSAQVIGPGLVRLRSDAPAALPTAPVRFNRQERR